MAKIYYTEDEAAAKLAMTKDQIKELVERAKLRVYADGVRRLYKVEEVDAMVGKGGAGEVELAPAEGAPQPPTLAEADKPAAPAGKEDTVLTSEGISIFDDEDLEIESGDPMAKTAIAPSVEEQGATAGVGSGSGLLDLTRESDDTSLGSEVLEHIDAEGASSGAAAVAEIAEQGAAAPEPVVVMDMPTVVEEIDRSAGVFAGLIMGATLVSLVIGAVVLAVMMQLVPPYVKALQQNMPVLLAGAVVVCAILAVVGYVIGKAATDRAAALQKGA